MSDKFWNPAVAPQLATGWAAMRDVLECEESAAFLTLKRAAGKNSDLHPHTCAGLISRAVRAGFLEECGAGKGRRARYRLTEKGRVAGRKPPMPPSCPSGVSPGPDGRR